MTDDHRAPSASYASTPETASRAGSSSPGGLFSGIIRLFSSIWLGVFLLTLLFIYSSIGSAGAPVHPNILDPAHWVAVRQLRWFEMTEMEWFHWWPFDLLIALICMNLVVATLRRIPFNTINLGVWMIHTGIIILALGSVWYFSTKVEGDAPVNRRRVVAMAPGMNDPVSMLALPGNSIVIGEGNDAYLLQIADIDPQWELLSGDEKGMRAHKISVRVQSRAGMFIRELIAGRPQYTQDIIPNPDAKPGAPPMVRAVNVLGKPFKDEALQLSLDYDPQQHFYLMDSRAIYLRELGATQWAQRRVPARQLPRFNDYVASSKDLWLPEGESMAQWPLHVAVPATDPNDPLPGVNLNVTGFLRYAYMDTRRRPDPNARLDPTASVRVLSTGPAQQYQLIAFDPNSFAALGGNLQIAWMESAEELEQLKQRVDPIIRFSVPGANVAVEHVIERTLAGDATLGFTPIEGTDYSYRVESVQALADLNVTVAITEIRTPARSYKRWIFNDASRNRDMAMAEGLSQHNSDVPRDENLLTELTPGRVPPAPIMLLAGPGENDLALMITKAVGQPRYQKISVGEQVVIADTVSLVVDRYAARTTTESRPYVVPREQQDRDLQKFMSMIRVDVPTNEGELSSWLSYHHFAFESPGEVLRRFPYRPQVLTMPDGRKVEMLFSRQRMDLPTPVVLEDFQVATHIGGFTGRSSSIMDWTSIIRFQASDGLTTPKSVSMNKPAEYRGFWFFQAQWDAPDRPRFDGDPPSRGLNYTVLGVGNRNGVNVQLAGCCIAVFGMFYAFYAKPMIKRRRQQRIYSEMKSHDMTSRTQSHMHAEPIGAAMKVQS